MISWIASASLVFILTACLSAANPDSDQGIFENGHIIDRAMNDYFHLLHSITVSDGSAIFGASISVSEKNIFIGDPGNNKVYVFSRGVFGLWKQTNIVFAPNGVQGFGYDLGHDGENLIIGSYYRGREITGSVFSYNEEEGLSLVAQSDDSYLLGFSVAGHSDGFAYSRRIQNDPEHQAGEVVVVLNGKEKILTAPDSPYYFGASIDMYENQLLALAPGLDSQGGAILFDVIRGQSSGQPLAVTSGARVALVGPNVDVAIGSGGCSVSGSGDPSGRTSVIWKSCKLGQMQTVEGSGQVEIFGDIVAFGGPDGREHFGPGGPFHVTFSDFHSPSQTGFRIASDAIQTSRHRSVGLNDRIIVVSIVPDSGKPILEIYGRNR
jgi:hypothetical protein